MKKNPMLNSYGGEEHSMQDFPKWVQDEVLETLKYYTEVHITYQNGEWYVSPGFAICKHYPKDHKYYGSIKHTQVYTK